MDFKILSKWCFWRQRCISTPCMSNELGLPFSHFHGYNSLAINVKGREWDFEIACQSIHYSTCQFHYNRDKFLFPFLYVLWSKPPKEEGLKRLSSWQGNHTLWAKSSGQIMANPPFIRCQELRIHPLSITLAMCHHVSWSRNHLPWRF